MNDNGVEIFGPREAGPVILVEYDPTWPARFEKERTTIEAALGSVAKLVEHIGSTAVPGLAAKPVVDILVAVDDVDDETSYLPALERAGYLLRVREKGHRMFRTSERDVHVHIWPAGGTEVRRHLTFRDRLRGSEADRALYERVKRELAQRDWASRNDYADAKSSVIAEITSRAQSAQSPNYLSQSTPRE